MIIYIEVQEDGQITGYGSSSFSDKCIEIEIDENHPIQREYGKYKYINGEFIEDLTFVIEEFKIQKDEELNKDCQHAISSGFKHTIDGIEYHFSFDNEAQFNFQGAERLLSGGFIPEIMWTVKQGGEYTRVAITKSVMNELMLVILLHKNSNVSRYRDVLMPLVKSATTVEELDLITWDVKGEI